MDDKTMVNDILSMINSSITGYANVITQTENQQLRQEIQQIRNKDEQGQYNLYKMAEQKGFYKPAAEATPQQIQEVKSELGGSNCGCNCGCH